MPDYHSHDRDPARLPTQGRCSKPVFDSSLKPKFRRHERRKAREEIRAWIGAGTHIHADPH